MHKSLVILAAGIGSRFGGGVKQLTPVDDNGHLIIDYSIHDAIAAGFDKIVFIIRHDIEADFRAVIGDRIEKLCKPLGGKRSMDRLRWNDGKNLFGAYFSTVIHRHNDERKTAIE